VSSLPDLVLAHSGTALIHGESLSYAALAGRAERVAAKLASRRFGPGDVLAIHAPNIPPWAGIALGAMLRGGAVTGVHPAATPREVAAQVADAGAKVLVTAGGTAARGAGDVTTSDAAARGAVDVTTSDAAGGNPAPDVLAIGPELLDVPWPAPAVAVAPGDVAFLPYSSGTTGLPKGVMLTHANLVASVGQIGSALGFSERDVVLAIPPFCHVMGFIVTLMAPLAAGATVVTLPRFDFAEMVALIERHRVTVLVVPPPVMPALARLERALPSLELIVSGGAPLSPAVHEAVAARFPQAAVGQGYGLTETAVGISGPRRGEGTKPGTCGRPLPGTEVRVVDGELWARGPQVMAGYLNAPDATAAMLAPGGWLRTGDAGHLDGDGNVVVADRLKELIKVNAHAVAPAELEALLTTHPHVADAAVVGREDARAGQVPVAVVVPCGALDLAELTSWVATQVAPHKRIREVRVVAEIPRTASGKILRRALA
jgi:acyl-CoA synthetase (AMP-forming)/AMP-acid ligase II